MRDLLIVAASDGDPDRLMLDDSPVAATPTQSTRKVRIGAIDVNVEAPNGYDVEVIGGEGEWDTPYSIRILEQPLGPRTGRTRDPLTRSVLLGQIAGADFHADIPVGYDAKLVVHPAGKSFQVFMSPQSPNLLFSNGASIHTEHPDPPKS